MNKKLLNHLILYIVAFLQDLEAPISTIRIIKFLYLIDYEHFIRREKTLTSIDWIRYFYGPYFKEWKETKNYLSIDLEEEEIIGQEKTSVTFRVYNEQRIDKFVDSGTEMCIDRILNKWAFEDIEVILDYIYTDTEPMQFSLLHEPLDFSRIRTDFIRKRKIEYINLGEKSSALVQESILSRKLSIPQLTQDLNDEYYEGINTMDKEDEIDYKIMSSAKILSSARNFFSGIE